MFQGPVGPEGPTGDTGEKGDLVSQTVSVYLKVICTHTHMYSIGV